MFGDKIKTHLQTELKGIHDAGLHKAERIIITPQSTAIRVSSGDEVLNFCANNYLGLANDPRLVQAACSRRCWARKMPSSATA